MYSLQDVSCKYKVQCTCTCTGQPHDTGSSAPLEPTPVAAVHTHSEESKEYSPKVLNNVFTHIHDRDSLLWE